MEEKILIKGVFTNQKILKVGGIICGLLFILPIINMISYFLESITIRETETATTATSSPTAYLVYLVYLALILIIFFTIYFIRKNRSLTVTDKRIFGTTCFGKRVDLPIDKVSAVEISLFKKICISTSSGCVKFGGCKNRDDVFDTISKLLSKRQEYIQINKIVTKQETPQSNADELKKFKDLLDSGVITQEDFYAKKKELLGL